MTYELMVDVDHPIQRFGQLTLLCISGPETKEQCHEKICLRSFLPVQQKMARGMKSFSVLYNLLLTP